MAENIIKMTNNDRNNVIYVSNTNAGQFAKLSEMYSKQAEQYALECSNFLKLIQRIYGDCINAQTGLELSFENILRHTEEEFAQDISQEVSDINDTVHYLKRILVELSYEPFEAEQWSKNENDDLYSLIIEAPVIFGVFDENKNKIFNINVQAIDNETVVLTALTPFNGYVCVNTVSVTNSDIIGGDYTEEELNELSIEDWDLI